MDELHISHIKFSTNALTSIQFKTTLNYGSPIYDDTEVFRFHWSDNGGSTWYYHEDWINWIVPRAGDYIVSFDDVHYTPVFGSNPSEAVHFTSVEFLPDYDPVITDFSRMFDGCINLVTMDLGNLGIIEPLVIPEPPRTVIWQPGVEYQVGDIVVSDDEVYVATAPSLGSTCPGYLSGWSPLGPVVSVVLDDPVVQDNTTQVLPQEVRKASAGISTNDIPE